MEMLHIQNFVSVILSSQDTYNGYLPCFKIWKLFDTMEEEASSKVSDELC